MKKITIFAVDDHTFIREMWKLVFKNNPEMELIGDSGDFDSAVQQIKDRRPDIVLLDINLKEQTGMNAVPLIRKFSPGTKIIAVSMHNEPAYAKKMLTLGALGYITKNSSHDEVFVAIKKVMNREVYICKEIQDTITKRVIFNEIEGPDIKTLSVREIGIIKLLKEGLSSKEIASTLSISEKTVQVHRHNILKKLGLKNSISLINFINTTDLSFN